MKKNNNKKAKKVARDGVLMTEDKRNIFCLFYMIFFTAFIVVSYKYGKKLTGVMSITVMLLTELFVLVPVFIKKYFAMYKRIISGVRFIPIISELNIVGKLNRMLQIVSLFIMLVCGVGSYATNFIGGISMDFVPIYFNLCIKGFFLSTFFFIVFRGLGYWTVYKDIHLVWIKCRREDRRHKDIYTSTIHFLCCCTAFIPLVRSAGIAYNIWKLSDILVYIEKRNRKKANMVRE